MAGELPYGWSEQYALAHCMTELRRLTEAATAMQQRIDYLEAEVTRLDMTKAGKPGRPRKGTAQPHDARKQETPE